MLPSGPYPATRRHSVVSTRFAVVRSMVLFARCENGRLMGGGRVSGATMRVRQRLEVERLGPAIRAHRHVVVGQDLDVHADYFMGEVW